MTNFIEEFTNSCIAKGKITPIQMIEFAKEEIFTIDNEIKKIENLKSKQSSLKGFIRQLGGSAGKIKPPVLIKKIENDEMLKQMCARVCAYIELKYPQSLTPREILDYIGSDQNKLVLTAILWLWNEKLFKEMKIHWLGKYLLEKIGKID